MDSDYDDIPDLLNYDGTIYDETKEPSQLNMLKYYFDKHKENLIIFKTNKFSHLTVDPAYTNNKKLDDNNYRTCIIFIS